MVALGTGIGWRPELASGIAGMTGLDWVEVVAENICPGHLPEPLRALRERGVTVVPHGVGLGLGGADRPSPARLVRLAHVAAELDAPLVSEHIAFVRSGGPSTGDGRVEAGHLLPVPRTREALDVLCENVRIAQDSLPVPLALENIATLVAWPDEELTEAQFLGELVERTGVRLLIDVANLHTDRVNHGRDPAAVLAALPLEALAYVHVAGGVERDGLWHDTHAHPVPQAVLALLGDLCALRRPPGVLLERDDAFPEPSELAAELAVIRAVVAATGGSARPAPVRGTAAPAPPTPNATRRPGPSLPRPADTAAARARLARSQHALLAALTTGAPAPRGFDPERLRVQRSALASKRAAVMARVAPQLPALLGDDYQGAALRYARRHPMTDGFHESARDFARRLTDRGTGPALSWSQRRRLRRWLRDHA
ncbi:DUF692 family multinuclear iron-containing protein [Streptomyces bohaiensis]